MWSPTQPWCLPRRARTLQQERAVARRSPEHPGEDREIEDHGLRNADRQVARRDPAGTPLPRVRQRGGERPAAPPGTGHARDRGDELGVARPQEDAPEEQLGAQLRVPAGYAREVAVLEAAPQPPREAR